MKDFGTIEEAVKDLQDGKLIMVLDDPDRENEGDLICAAEFATTENVNFMAVHAKGLICNPLSYDIARRLQFPQMVSENTESHETAFTVSIDHISTTTGISAEERGMTMRAIVDENSQALDSAAPATSSRWSRRSTACSSGTATPRPRST